jgi:sarcosine oxidase
MERIYRTIVVGAGVMGTAAAWRAARRNAGARRGSAARTLLLERFAIGHDRGSSHGDSRITRLTYHAPTYVRLAREAFALYEELERETGEVLFFRTGDLFFGDAAGPIAAYEAVLEAEGVPFERFSAPELARRFPQFRLDPGERALFQPAGGILAADRVVAAQARAARAHGAEIREGERLLRVDRGRDPIEIETTGGRYRAERLVLAGGAWMGKLLPELGLPIRVLKQEVFYFSPPPGRADDYRMDRFPVWVRLGGAGGRAASAERSEGGPRDDIHFYGFPLFGRFGLKLARFLASGPGEEPDAIDRSISAASVEAHRAFLARHIPGPAHEPLLRAETCLFEMTPDEDFVIDCYPGDSRIVIAGGFSGHGFKFGPAIGEALASLALDGRSSVRAIEDDRARFTVARFDAKFKGERT